MAPVRGVIRDLKICEYCNRGYVPSGLRTHQLRAHKDILLAKFTCDCKEQFLDQAALDRHLQFCDAADDQLKSFLPLTTKKTPAADDGEKKDGGEVRKQNGDEGEPVTIDSD